MLDEIQKNVLMADDDEEDCFLATEAFTESGTKAGFSCVQDGIKLMDYLSACADARQSRLPDLILLDLNMPRKDGREALLEIKSNPVLQSIPVVILTTSSEEKDMDFSKKAGADSFVTKPGTFSEWIEMMKSLAGQWLSV
jgi:CheY-like chemotaxis protein